MAPRRTRVIRPDALLAVAALCIGAWLLLKPVPVQGYGTPAPADEDNPWGELTLRRIVISPPLEYIPTNAGPIWYPKWAFPHTTIDDVTRILTEAGFSAADVTRLGAAAQPDVSIRGFAIVPEPALVRAMAPDVRAKLYAVLVKYPVNFDQQAAYRFYGTLEEWLGSDLSPETRALVDPLIYRSGDFLSFADIELVRAKIGNGPELQHLLKRLLRQSTVLVSLRVDDASEVQGLTEYWGRGGRKMDIRPLLETMAESGPDHSIDIIHLLPSMVRSLLYRYPQVTLEDLRKPQLPNCYWTALNFFASEPDDRLRDPAFALERLSKDYFVVQDRLQLGDIVAFSDSEMNIFHVAVYIADGLVFTKNGFSSLAPWTIVPVDRLIGHFPANADDWHITYYRRKDL